MNRREFLQQLSCAMAVAGLASTIPLAVHAEEPEPEPELKMDFAEGFNVITHKFPSPITGMVRFQDTLVVTTRDHGVCVIKERDFMIKEFWKIGDDTVAVHPYIHPAAVEYPDFQVVHLGFGPYHYAPGLGLNFTVRRTDEEGPMCITVHDGR
jgi:hypothetical protein